MLSRVSLVAPWDTIGEGVLPTLACRVAFRDDPGRAESKRIESELSARPLMSEPTDKREELKNKQTTAVNANKIKI